MVFFFTIHNIRKFGCFNWSECILLALAFHHLSYVSVKVWNTHQWVLSTCMNANYLRLACKRCNSLNFLVHYNQQTEKVLCEYKVVPIWELYEINMLLEFASKLISPDLMGSWYSSSVTEDSHAFTRATQTPTFPRIFLNF